MKNILSQFYSFFYHFNAFNCKFIIMTCMLGFVTNFLSFYYVTTLPPNAGRFAPKDILHRDIWRRDVSCYLFCGKYAVINTHNSCWTQRASKLVITPQGNLIRHLIMIASLIHKYIWTRIMIWYVMNFIMNIRIFVRKI